MCRIALVLVTFIALAISLPVAEPGRKSLEEGLPVFSYDLYRMGTVDSIIVNAEGASSYLVKRSGFLGFGGSLVVVPKVEPYRTPQGYEIWHTITARQFDKLPDYRK